MDNNLIVKEEGVDDEDVQKDVILDVQPGNITEAEDESVLEEEEEFLPKSKAPKPHSSANSPDSPCKHNVFRPGWQQSGLFSLN